MIARLLILGIRIYQLVVSPFMGNQCRFHPTCSHYGREALERHGAAKGSVLAVSRILRCHPWSRGSWIDPVPERFAWAEVFRYKRPTKQGSGHDACKGTCTHQN